MIKRNEGILSNLKPRVKREAKGIFANLTLRAIINSYFLINLFPYSEFDLISLHTGFTRLKKPTLNKKRVQFWTLVSLESYVTSHKSYDIIKLSFELPESVTIAGFVTVPGVKFTTCHRFVPLGHPWLKTTTQADF